MPSRHADRGASGGEASSFNDGGQVLGPGAKRRRGEQPKDPVRVMLLDRISERGLTIADLSRALRRNDAYMHQFIWRASPQWLNEVDRAVVCQILDLPESVLRPPMPDTALVSRPRRPQASSSVADERDVPLFREDDLIDLAGAREWTHRIPGLFAGPVFAVWIAQQHGLFGPGDVIHVHQRHPPRVGDHVVVIAGQRVGTIGKLAATSGGTAHIQVANELQTAIPAGAAVHKVVAAVYS